VIAPPLVVKVLCVLIPVLPVKESVPLTVIALVLVTVAAEALKLPKGCVAPIAPLKAMVPEPAEALTLGKTLPELLSRVLAKVMLLFVVEMVLLVPVNLMGEFGKVR